MDNINVFKNSKMRILYSQPPKIISWITIVSLTIFIFFIIACFYEYNVYIKLYGYVDVNEKYNIQAVANKGELPFRKNYKLFIEGKKYDYKIVNIKEYDGYYKIYIDCKIDKNLLIKNNSFTLNFIKYKTTLINELIKKIKKGMM